MSHTQEPASLPWYAESSEIAALLFWMNRHDEYGPLEVDNCIEIVATPWSWDAEYQEMLAERKAEDEAWLRAEQERLDARPRFESTGRLWRRLVPQTCACGHEFYADSNDLKPEGHQCPECDLVSL